MKQSLKNALGRGKLTVLAVVVALALVAAPAAFAANGNPFILGKAENTATKVTGLIGNVASAAALKVTNLNGGPALDLRVNIGVAPMKVNSSTRVDNLNADQLDGQDSSQFVPTNTNSFVRNSPYRDESILGPGSERDDGTARIDVSCSFGDRLLSGGPANVNAGSDLVESFPASTTTWAVVIQKNGLADNFSAVALCANQ